MKLDLRCKDLTRLVLEGEDRPLALSERVAIRLHLTICRYCPPFVRQVRFMRAAVGRWKGYAEDQGPPPGA